VALSLLERKATQKRAENKRAPQRVSGPPKRLSDEPIALTAPRVHRPTVSDDRLTGLMRFDLAS